MPGQTPGSFEGCIFDCEHILQMKSIEKQHSIELERKRKFIDNLFNNNVTDGDSIDEWHDSSSQSAVDKNLSKCMSIKQTIEFLFILPGDLFFFRYKQYKVKWLLC